MTTQPPSGTQPVEPVVVTFLGASIDAAGLFAALALLADSRTYLSSIHEVVSLEDGGPRRQLQIDYSVPLFTGAQDAAAAEFLFPVLAPTSAAHFWSLEADEHGTRLPVITGSAAEAIESILLATLVSSLDGTLAVNDADLQGAREVIRSARRARRSVLEREPDARVADNGTFESFKLTGEDLDAQDDDLSTRYRRAFANDPATRSTLEFLAVSELVFAHVPKGRAAGRHLTITSVVEHFDRKRHASSRVRTLLGMRPFVFRCEVPALLLTDNYWFELIGPADHYIRYEGWVVESVATIQAIAGQQTEADGQRTYQVRPTGPPVSIGQLVEVGRDGSGDFTSPRTKATPVASLRWSEQRTDRPVQSLVVFNERAPGSLSIAALYCLVCLVALVAGAAGFKQLVRAPGISAETAILLFSLPGTVALWTIPRRRSLRIVDPPLLATASVFLIGFASYLCGIAFLLADIASFRMCPNIVTCRVNPDPPVHVFHFGVGLGSWHLTGQVILDALVLFSFLIYVWLLLRAGYSVSNFRRAVNHEKPRALPNLLLKSGP
jgi:hypothetical protein